MKIAICDDSKQDVYSLKTMIEKSRYCPSDIEIFEFSSGEKLLECFLAFDAVFLDLHMDGMNGSEVGARLRKKDPEVMILFYTDYDMNASRILKARPWGYLMKGMSNKELMISINEVLKILSEKMETKITITNDGNVIMLRLADVLYISIQGKGSKVWLTKRAAKKYDVPYDGVEGAGIKSAIKLEDYYEKLRKHGFIYGNVSYIINANHIERRVKNSVILTDGIELSISRSRKTEFDVEFGHYWGVQCGRKRVRSDGD